MPLINQKELIKRCIERDIKAQKEIYTYYSRKMMGVCVRYADSFDEAKDFLQESFIQIFEKMESFSHNGSFEGWIRRIVVNTCLMQLRKVRPIFNEVEDLELSGTSLYSELNEKDILNFVQKLPQGFRMVFNLFAIEGYSHKEIAEKLDISEGTSKSQYSRARKALQEMLLEEQKVSA